MEEQVEEQLSEKARIKYSAFLEVWHGEEHGKSFEYVFFFRQWRQDFHRQDHD